MATPEIKKQSLMDYLNGVDLNISSQIYSKLQKFGGLFKEQTGKQLEDEDFDQILHEISQLELNLVNLKKTGVELSKEQDQNRVLEIIVESARGLTNADGGTVYLVKEEYEDDPLNPGEVKDRFLVFKVLQNETMNTYQGGTRGKIDFLPPVPLYKGEDFNLSNVSAYCANKGEIINVADVYNVAEFDFSGTKKYDEQSGYRSKSMLVIPLRDHENMIIGVLQLINSRHPDGTIRPFTSNDQELVQAVAYQAAVTITSQRLLNEQVTLFDSFLTVITKGLGEKSPHTYAHIHRVTKLTEILARSLNHYNNGMYKDISFSDEELHEISLAGRMHDIGKITTPEHVVAKQIKLQVLMDRFELIAEKANSMLKDLEIEALRAEKNLLYKGVRGDELLEKLSLIETEKKEKIEKIIADLKVLHKTNTGGEFLEQERQTLILENAERELTSYIKTEYGESHGEIKITAVDLIENGEKKKFLTEEEKKLLLISKGTLSDAERKIINDHAERSWRWLMRLQFPKKMYKLPLYAAAHHEHLDGTGYPKNLVAAQLPIQARIIAVADIFEALVSSDRPYKTPMKLSRALEILGFMVKNNHIDAEIVKILLVSGAIEEFSNKYIKPEQIDEIDVQNWLDKFYPSDFAYTIPPINPKNNPEY